jgi:hypothetical protein
MLDDEDATVPEATELGPDMLKNDVQVVSCEYFIQVPEAGRESFVRQFRERLKQDIIRSGGTIPGTGFGGSSSGEVFRFSLKAHYGSAESLIDVRTCWVLGSRGDKQLYLTLTQVNIP